MITSKKLRHVVLFKFNDKADQAQVKRIEADFLNLANTLDLVHDFEWGTNVSIEDVDKGFTHCFFVTFLSKEDRDAYVPHPQHQAFVASIQAYLEDVCVLDYWENR